MRSLRDVYPGWWVALASCACLGLADGMMVWAFGLFVGPLEAEFGWSRSEIGTAMGVLLLASGGAAPLVGWLVDRWGPRRVILVGGAMVASLYLALTTVRELWHAVALFGVLGFFQTWVLFVPFTSMIHRWFPTRASTPIAIAMSGACIGGLVAPTAIVCLLSVTGWRGTLCVVAVLTLAANGAFVAAFRSEPRAPREPAPARRPGSNSPTESAIWDHATLGAVVGAPAFWLVTVGFALFFSAQNAVIFHAPLIFGAAGMTEWQSALVLSFAAASGLVVQLGSGALVDRVRRPEWLAAAVLLSMVAALGACLVGSDALPLAVFALLWGIAGGLGTSLEPLLVGRLYGQRQFGAIYGALDAAETAASVPGPWAGGAILAVTGSPTSLVVLYGGLSLIGATSFAILSLCVARARDPAPRRSREVRRLRPHVARPGQLTRREVLGIC